MTMSKPLDETKSMAERAMDRWDAQYRRRINPAMAGAYEGVGPYTPEELDAAYASPYQEWFEQTGSKLRPIVERSMDLEHNEREL